MMSARAFGFLFVLLAFLWGGSFVAIKFAIEVFDPWFSASFRLIVATLTLLLIFQIRKRSFFIPWNLRWKIWLTGLFTLGVPFSLLFWGERYVSAGLAGMTNGTTPLWTACLAAIVSVEERQFLKNPWVLCGLFLGFLGMIALFAPLASVHGGEEIFGALAILGMAVCYAVGNVLNRLFFTGNAQLNLSASAFHQHLSSLVYLSLGSLFFGAWPTSFNWSEQAYAWIALFYLGIFSTAIALLVYFTLIRQWGAVKTSAVTYLVPVFAVILDFFIFQTKPHFLSVFGIALVLVGVYFIRTARAPRQKDSNRDKGNTQKLANA